MSKTMGPIGELPLLDESLCCSSAVCVECCPAECLEMNDAIPWLARPRDCISCGLCALLCPTGAIRMAVNEKA